MDDPSLPFYIQEDPTPKANESSIIHLFNRLIQVCTYKAIRIANPYLLGKPLSTRVQCLYTGSFAQTLQTILTSEFT